MSPDAGLRQPRPAARRAWLGLWGGCASGAVAGACALPAAMALTGLALVPLISYSQGPAQNLAWVACGACVLAPILAGAWLLTGAAVALAAALLHDVILGGRSHLILLLPPLYAVLAAVGLAMGGGMLAAAAVNGVVGAEVVAREQAARQRARLTGPSPVTVAVVTGLGGLTLGQGLWWVGAAAAGAGLMAGTADLVVREPPLRPSATVRPPPAGSVLE